jgi:hypothetical protein
VDGSRVAESRVSQMELCAVLSLGGPA